MTQTQDLDTLRAVAEGATPGPWQNGIDDLEGVVAPHNPGLGNVVCIPPLKRMYSSLAHWPANAAFIATFDPPTVLALLSRLDRYEKALGEVVQTAKNAEMPDSGQRAGTFADGVVAGWRAASEIASAALQKDPTNAE